MKSPHLNSTLAGHSPSSCCEARNQRVPRAHSHVGASLLSGAAGWHRAVPVELGGAGALFASLNPQPRAPTPQQLPRALFCKGLCSHRLKWALLLQPRAWPGRSMFRAVPHSLSCPRPAFLRKGLRAWSWGWGGAGRRQAIPSCPACGQPLGPEAGPRPCGEVCGRNAWLFGLDRACEDVRGSRPGLSTAGSRCALGDLSGPGSALSMPSTGPGGASAPSLCPRGYLSPDIKPAHDGDQCALRGASSAGGRAPMTWRPRSLLPARTACPFLALLSS